MSSEAPALLAEKTVGFLGMYRPEDWQDYHPKENEDDNEAAVLGHKVRFQDFWIHIETVYKMELGVGEDPCHFRLGVSRFDPQGTPVYIPLNDEQAKVVAEIDERIRAHRDGAPEREQQSLLDEFEKALPD